MERIPTYVQLLRRVTVTANEATNLEGPLRATLSLICEHTGWPVGHVYMRATEPPYDLVPTDIWHFSDASKFKTFRDVTERTRLASGEGLPGQVLALGRPKWIRDVTEHANFPRARLARDIGVRAAFGFPIKVGSDIPAVLEFFSSAPQEPDEEFLDIVDQVGIQLGRVFERMRMEEALRNLAQGVSAVKGDAFFLSLCHHLVRTLRADYALIGTLTEEGAVRTLAACDRERILERIEYRLQDTPCRHVVTENACLYARDVVRIFPKDKMLADMGIEGYAGTPLRDSRGKTLGLIVVLFKQPIESPATVEPLLQVFGVRAAAELERQRSQRSLEKLALFPRADPNPVLEFAADGTLTYFNAAAERLARSMGKAHPSEIVPTDTPGIVAKCLDTGVNGIVMETSGGDRTVSWAFIPVTRRNVVLAYAVEISFLLTLEAELRKMHMLDSGGKKPAGPRRGPRRPKRDANGGRAH